MASRPDLEKVVESYLRDSATARGWLCPKTISPGAAGFPDRTVITDDGTVCFVEVKRPGGRPRKLQLHAFLRPMLAHGANVCVVDDEPSVDVLLAMLADNTPIHPSDTQTMHVMTCPDALKYT
jgi:hypothetical protein